MDEKEYLKDVAHRLYVESMWHLGCMIIYAAVIIAIIVCRFTTSMLPCVVILGILVIMDGKLLLKNRELLIRNRARYEALVERSKEQDES